ncbi:hypothetical protein [Mycobacterium sp.]
MAPEIAEFGGLMISLDNPHKLAHASPRSKTLPHDENQTTSVDDHLQ